MTSKKASVTNIWFVGRTIEGLFREGSNGEDEFGIAAPQIAEFYHLDKTNVNKQIKSLLDGRFDVVKWVTELNNRSVNCINLDAFEYLNLKLYKKGNPVAEEVVEELVGLALRQVFADAFNRKFEKEDRDKWRVVRNETKKLYRVLTDAIQRYLVRNNIFDEFWHYSNAADQINMGLFGKKAKQIRAELGKPKGSLNRDDFSFRALMYIDKIQDLSAINIDRGQNPKDAIDSALDAFNIVEPMPYK